MAKIIIELADDVVGSEHIEMFNDIFKEHYPILREMHFEGFK